MSLNLYPIGKLIVKIILTPLYRIQTIGKENFPKDGGVLICSNHIDNLDPPVVGLTCPRDYTFYGKRRTVSCAFIKTAATDYQCFSCKKGNE